MTLAMRVFSIQHQLSSYKNTDAAWRYKKRAGIAEDIAIFNLIEVLIAGRGNAGGEIKSKVYQNC